MAFSTLEPRSRLKFGSPIRKLQLPSDQKKNESDNCQKGSRQLAHICPAFPSERRNQRFQSLDRVVCPFTDFLRYLFSESKRDIETYAHTETPKATFLETQILEESASSSVGEIISPNRLLTGVSVGFEYRYLTCQNLAVTPNAIEIKSRIRKGI
jgi:hypothetical protein